MTNSTVEIHPNALPTTPVTTYADSWIHRIPGLYAEGLNAESNKNLVRRFIQKIYHEGELSLLSDFMSLDVVNHELADSFGDSEPAHYDIKLMADFVYLYRHAFPDLRLDIQDQMAEGDRVVTSLRMRGTHENALMTIAASGRKIDIAGIRVDRMAGGKIVESWVHVDALGMLRQLHALPALNRQPQKVAPDSYETAPGTRLPVTTLNRAPVLPQPGLFN